MTDIPTILMARGYREYPGIGGEVRFFQKAFEDDRGRRYFLNFLEWNIVGIGIAYETRICCDTATDGYAWLTFREPTVELAEVRAECLWQAVGAKYYQENTPRL